MPAKAIVPSIAIDPADAQTMFAGTESSGLYKSANAGENWTIVAAGLPAELHVTSIVFNPANHAMLFAGSLQSGVYRSLDHGQTWEQINDGLRMRAVLKLAISSNGQILYAATYGEGVYRLNDAEGPVHVQTGPQPPVSFELRQNYPNPFNPATEIRYSLHKSARVRLKIFSFLGQEIMTLVDERKPAGAFSATWNGVDQQGRRVASGVYLHELRVGGLVAVKKMLFMQ